jgi:hypothetical protein
MAARGSDAWLCKRLDPRHMYCVVPNHGFSEAFGALIVHSDAFRTSGGYDPEFVGWGAEDGDIRLRLYLEGIKCIPVPEEMLVPISHENRIRAENYAETDFKKSRKANFTLFNAKLKRVTGRSFPDWWNSQEILGLWKQAARG